MLYLRPLRALVVAAGALACIGAGPVGPTAAEKKVLERAAGPNATERDVDAAMKVVEKYPVSQADLDTSIKQMEQAQADARSSSSENSRKRISSLRLPATDTASALSYCAFVIRYINSRDSAPLQEARGRVGFQPSNAKAVEAAKLVNFGDLFPTLDPLLLSFDRTVGGALNERVFFDSGRGNCSVLSREAGAYDKVTAWLNTPESGLVELPTRNKGWKVYGYRQPTSWEQSIRVFNAIPTKAMTSAGFTSAIVVAVVGLP